MKDCALLRPSPTEPTGAIANDNHPSRWAGDEKINQSIRGSLRDQLARERHPTADRPCAWISLGAGHNSRRISRDQFKAHRMGAYRNTLFIAVDRYELPRDAFEQRLRRSVGLRKDPQNASLE